MLEGEQRCEAPGAPCCVAQKSTINKRDCVFLGCCRHALDLIFTFPFEAPAADEICIGCVAEEG